ncbi:unnamed protein product [Durusdinium trenchii]|uniref:Alkaline proteinase inhibitor/ Outer membrane lipoprotein Omp19 domain-containing protein n=2 Tax=Durusdinium trenchii TaxID=1381693 RepID=A0ABP0KTA0_9DINO
MRRQQSAKAALLLAAVALIRCTTFITPSNDSNRRDFLQKLAVGLTVATVDSSGAPAAHAAIARWSGLYDDPKHPGCERAITKDGGEFVISGTSAADGSKECAEDGPTKRWYLVAQPGESSDELIIDFSPKGGPKDAVAKLDGDGIVFPDGNRWSKIKRKPGAAAGTYLDGPASPLSKFAKGKVPQ